MYAYLPMLVNTAESFNYILYFIALVRFLGVFVSHMTTKTSTVILVTQSDIPEGTTPQWAETIKERMTHRYTIQEMK